jgi:hypothetical protein
MAMPFIREYLKAPVSRGAGIAAGSGGGQKIA